MKLTINNKTYTIRINKTNTNSNYKRMLNIYEGTQTLPIIGYSINDNLAKKAILKDAEKSVLSYQNRDLDGLFNLKM